MTVLHPLIFPQWLHMTWDFQLHCVTSAMSLGLRFCMSKKGMTGGGGWVPWRVQTAWLCLDSLVESLGWHWKEHFCPFGINRLRNMLSYLVGPPFLVFMAHFSATQGWHFRRALTERSLIVGVVRVTYMIKMAEISSGRSLDPNIPREPKLRYFLWHQRLKRISGK